MLLLSYHFPPGQATGALRWQQMAVVADQRGWALDVLTCHPDDLTTTDPGRLDSLPESVRVFGVRRDPTAISAWEQRASRLIRRFRRRPAPGVPLARSAPAPLLDTREQMRWSATPGGLSRAWNGWRNFADDWCWAGAAQRVAEQLIDGHDLIASCGPPHMPHIAASNVASRTGTPHLMDMRDPWSLAPALPREIASPLWYRLAESYEASALSSAVVAVVNTQAHARALGALHPEYADRIITVMNGCDRDPIPEVEESRFIVCYAGNIYIDRDPRLVFRAVARLVREQQLTPEQVGIELLGHVDSFGGIPIRELADSEGISEFLTIYPRMPRNDALAIMARAAVLVSLPQDIDLAIPSKVFEYTQFNAWLLALARPSSATADVLEGSGADVVLPDDEARIAEVIRQHYADFRRSGRPQPINRNGRFDRTAQANYLFDILEERVPLGERVKVQTA